MQAAEKLTGIYRHSFVAQAAHVFGIDMYFECQQVGHAV